MTPIEKDKIVALCEKWGLKELNFTKGIFIAENGTGITVNLRGDNPLVGITIAGELHTEGHGNLKAEDYQREVEVIMKSSSKKSLSFKHSTDTSKHLVDTNVATLQASEGVSSQSSQNDNIAPPAKLHKAKCKECNVESELTLDAAQKIYEEYGAIYCEICRTNVKATYEKKEDMGFIYQDVTKTKGEKSMDEKLPAINENKLAVTENKLTVDMIKQYICPTATDAEAYNFLQLCVYRKLNPFLKEAYLIKYGNAPATMVVGKDTFTKKAEESGELDGFEAGIIVLNKDKQIERRVGVVQYEGDTLVGGWAKIFRKDMKYPFVCEVPLSEYMKYKDGKPQSSWATLPGTMIRKVALVQSLREAFTAELGGCYDKSEMEIEEK